MAKETEKAIAKSLVKLLNEKPLNKITISDIAEDCGINRMTFYYHFKDIYNLVEWIVETSFQGVLTCAEDHSWQGTSAYLFECMVENKVFLINVCHSISREQVSNYLMSLLFPVLMDFINTFPKADLVRDEDKKFVANMYAVGLVGMILQWISNDMQDDWHPMLDKMSIICSGCFEDAIERLLASYDN